MTAKEIRFTDTEEVRFIILLSFLDNYYHFYIMNHSEPTNIFPKKVDSEINEETLDNLILGAINSICCNKKGPDSNSIFNYVNKKLGNLDITRNFIETRLSHLIDNGKLKIKYKSEISSF